MHQGCQSLSRLCVEIRLKNDAILCLSNMLNFYARGKNLLSDFKGLSTVATVLDHQSNKTMLGLGYM